MVQPLRFLLLQVRNFDDPMLVAEVRSFARALRVREEQIAVADLLAGFPHAAILRTCDAVLLGGSGHYSVAHDSPWLDEILAGLAELCQSGKSTFASCWGFQAIARALGGRVIHDVERAEVGTLPITLTEAGRRDPIFGALPLTFLGQLGHEDHVVELPPGAIRLAYSAKAEHQAFCLAGRPVYCTQFHPELNRDDFLARLEAYPQYVAATSGMTLEQFRSAARDTPEAESLLPRFVETFLGPALA